MVGVIGFEFIIYGVEVCCFVVELYFYNLSMLIIFKLF